MAGVRPPGFEVQGIPVQAERVPGLRGFRQHPAWLVFQAFLVRAPVAGLVRPTPVACFVEHVQAVPRVPHALVAVGVIIRLVDETGPAVGDAGAHPPVGAARRGGAGRFARNNAGGHAAAWIRIIGLAGVRRRGLRVARVPLRAVALRRLVGLREPAIIAGVETPGHDADLLGLRQTVGVRADGLPVPVVHFNVSAAGRADQHVPGRQPLPGALVPGDDGRPTDVFEHMGERSGTGRLVVHVVAACFQSGVHEVRAIVVLGAVGPVHVADALVVGGLGGPSQGGDDAAAGGVGNGSRRLEDRGSGQGFVWGVPGCFNVGCCRGMPGGCFRSAAALIAAARGEELVDGLPVRHPFAAVLPVGGIGWIITVAVGADLIVGGDGEDRGFHGLRGPQRLIRFPIAAGQFVQRVLHFGLDRGRAAKLENIVPPVSTPLRQPMMVARPGDGRVERASRFDHPIAQDSRYHHRRERQAVHVQTALAHQVLDDPRFAGVVFQFGQDLRVHAHGRHAGGLVRARVPGRDQGRVHRIGRAQPHAQHHGA